MIERTVSWQGVDDEHRNDVASVLLDHDRMTGSGTSRTPHYLLRWSLVTCAGWVTRSLDVRVEARTWSRNLALSRAENGQWSSEGLAEGVPVTTDGRPLAIWGSDWVASDPTPPGIVDPASLIGADDCDLGLCPVTNTMPMLRSVLPRPGGLPPTVLPGPEIEFVMAWVEVPSLRVIRSEQIYQLRRLDRDGGALVRYVGLHRSFEGDLDVDPDGLVINYPQLARRVGGNE